MNVSKLDFKIRPIGKNTCFEFVSKHHYSKIRPKLTRVCLGGFIENKMVAVISLGWGVRPIHTIKKLFPSLTTKDYFEIGKMCVDDIMSKNTESQFLKQVILWTKLNLPNIKLIFTWADGMLGKPGYVYQASNFLYGGFIWTDTYFLNGEKIHPRATGKIGGRPSKRLMEKMGILHYRGKQFRYIYFLCSNKERKLLLKSTKFLWTTLNMPKEKDIQWLVYKNGKWIASEKPIYNRNNTNFASGASFKRETSLFQSEEFGAIPKSRFTF